MYCPNEPSALFHALHHSHRKRTLEEQACRGVGDLGSPMLLLALLQGEMSGQVYSQREIAKQMRLSPATVAASLKSLERQGYVARTADARDARRNQVSLTGRGREAVELCCAAFRAVDAQMLLGFTDKEQRQLDGFFKRMLENLGGPPDWPPPPDLPHEKECDIL